MFRWPAGAQSVGVVATLEEVATLRFTLPSIPLATGADMSPDGGEIVVRTYDRLFLWPRPAGTSVAAAFDTAPCEYPVPAGALGEAVAFTADGRDPCSPPKGSAPRCTPSGAADAHRGRPAPDNQVEDRPDGLHEAHHAPHPLRPAHRGAGRVETS